MEMAVLPMDRKVSLLLDVDSRFFLLRVIRLSNEDEVEGGRNGEETGKGDRWKF